MITKALKIETLKHTTYLITFSLEIMAELLMLFYELEIPSFNTLHLKYASKTHEKVQCFLRSTNMKTFSGIMHFDKYKRVFLNLSTGSWLTFKMGVDKIYKVKNDTDTYRPVSFFGSCSFQIPINYAK